jgi:hypothetical protein
VGTSDEFKLQSSAFAEECKKLVEDYDFMMSGYNSKLSGFVDRAVGSGF